MNTERASKKDEWNRKRMRRYIFQRFFAKCHGSTETAKNLWEVGVAFPYVDVVAGAVHLGVGLLAEPVPAHLPHELIHPLLEHSLLPPLLPRIKSVPRPGTAPILFGRDLPARPNRDGDEGWKEPEREGGGSPAAPATSFLFSSRVGGGGNF